MSHKYIRLHAQGFILWPDVEDCIWHSEIASIAARRGDVVLSAGFAHFTGGQVFCEGHSESLGVRSRADDAQALGAQLGL